MVLVLYRALSEGKPIPLEYKLAYVMKAVVVAL